MRLKERDCKPLPNITNNKARTSDLIWDKTKGEWVLPIWTDGAKTPEGDTACAVVIGKRHKSEEGWKGVSTTSSTAAELEALEKALSIRPSNAKTVIFTDSKAAIALIEKGIAKEKDARKTENATIVKRIRDIMASTPTKGQRRPEILWTPSHIDEHKDKEKADRAEAQLDRIRQRFEVDRDTLKKGNSIADDTAKQALKKKQKYKGLTGQPKVLCKINNTLYEANIRKMGLQTLTKQEEEHRKKRFRGGGNDMEQNRFKHIKQTPWR